MIFLTVFDVNPPGASWEREAPRGGGGQAEPALVGGLVDEYGHGVVGVGVELEDAGGEGGRGGAGGEAHAEEPGVREREGYFYLTNFGTRINSQLMKSESNCFNSTEIS